MDRPITRTFIAHVEDKPGVLNRVVSLFRRRNFNIESLTVGHTHEPGVSRLTMLVQADDDMARRMQAHLYKQVNVLRVDDITHTPGVSRDLALIKVKAESSQRAEVREICNVFRARVVDMGAEAMIVEITGEQDKIDGLVALLKPFGIVEMVNSGVVAMTRCAQATGEHQAQKSERVLKAFTAA